MVNDSELRDVFNVSKFFKFMESIRSNALEKGLQLVIVVCPTTSMLG